MNKEKTKILIKFVLIIVFQFHTQLSYCQEKPYYNYNSAYSQQRREGAAANDALSDRNRIPNKPSSSYNAYTPSKEESDKINAWWKSLINPVNAVKKPELTQAEKDENRASTIAFYKNQFYKQDVKRNFVNAYKTQIKNFLTYFGFSKYEAKLIFEREISEKIYGNANIKKNIEEKGLLLESVNENLNTSSFEILEEKILALLDINASCSALKFSDILQLRFPNKTTEIDAIRVKALHNFYAYYNREFFEFATFDDDYRYITNTYLALEDKYPTIYNEFVNRHWECNSSKPYDVVSSYYYNLTSSDGWQYYPDVRDYYYKGTRFENPNGNIRELTIYNKERSNIVNLKTQKLEKEGKILFNRNKKLDSLSNKTQQIALKISYNKKMETLEGVTELAKLKKVSIIDLMANEEYGKPNTFAIAKKLADQGDDEALKKAYETWQSMYNQNAKYRDFYTKKEMGRYTHETWIDYLITRSQNNNGCIDAIKILINNKYFERSALRNKNFIKVDTELKNYYDGKYNVEKTIEVLRLLTIPEDENQLEMYLSYEETASQRSAWYYYYIDNKLKLPAFLGIAKYAAMKIPRAMEIQNIFGIIEKDPEHKLIYY